MESPGAVFTSAHRKIISVIHLGFQDKRFAVWEIEKVAEVSKSSAAHIMARLVDLRLLKRHRPSYRHRNYETTRQWDHNVMKVIEIYELARMLNI